MSYQQNDTCMSELARACGIPTRRAAGEAYGCAVPAVIEGLVETTKTRAGTAGLLTAARALSWVERSEPGGLFSSIEHRIGADVINKIFGPSAPAVRSRLAEEAGIADVSARGLLEITGLVTLATLTGVSGDEFTEAAFVGAIQAESRHPVSATDRPSRASAPNGPVERAPLLPNSARRGADPAFAGPIDEPEGGRAISADDGRMKKRLLLAGVVAAVALLGFGIMAIGGDDSDTAATQEVAADPAASAEGEEPADPAPVASTSTSQIDQQPETTHAFVEVVTLAVPMHDIEDANNDARGTLTFDLNQVTGEVCYEVEAENIEGPYRSHIHIGGLGVKGGIVVDLGPLDNGAVGCVNVRPVDTKAILADRVGHYAELHDASEEWTIRGQMSEAEAMNGDTEPPLLVDTDGGGAHAVLDHGVIYLEGDVADQATADDLVGSLAGVDDATRIVNNLRVSADAPVPSGRVIIADAIFFDVNSDEVKAIEQDTLAAIVAVATSRDDWQLTIVGHTDDVGPEVFNLELSLRRAGALRDLLVEQGVPEERLGIQGAGETTPIGDNNTEAGRSQNRRIEFELTPTG